MTSSGIYSKCDSIYFNLLDDYDRHRLYALNKVDCAVFSTLVARPWGRRQQASFGIKFGEKFSKYKILCVYHSSCTEFFKCVEQQLSPCNYASGC